MLSQQITIIIPTYNEEKYIGRTLNAIALQSGTSDVKIIISDARSTDSTRLIATTIASELKLNLEIIDGGLPAIGRNAGAKLATTQYVLFLDADVTFAHDHVIVQAVNELAFMGYYMVGTNPIYKGKLDIRAYIMFKINKYITWFLSKTEPFAIGGFIMVYTSLFNDLGGFDERATQSEDWLLSKKIAPNRFKLIPDLITQDNRRFKKFGYFKMIQLLYNNWMNKNNIDYFYKDQKYF
jgi:glycosyltransferase involved in cell wall biosynthesis